MRAQLKITSVHNLGVPVKKKKNSKKLGRGIIKNLNNNQKR